LQCNQPTTFCSAGAAHSYLACLAVAPPSWPCIPIVPGTLPSEASSKCQWRCGLSCCATATGRACPSKSKIEILERALPALLWGYKRERVSEYHPVTASSSCVGIPEAPTSSSSRDDSLPALTMRGAGPATIPPPRCGRVESASRPVVPGVASRLCAHCRGVQQPVYRQWRHRSRLQRAGRAFVTSGGEQRALAGAPDR